MKIKKEEVKPTVRNKYSAQIKERVLERTDRDGIPTVAKDRILPNRRCIQAASNKDGYIWGYLYNKNH